MTNVVINDILPYVQTIATLNQTLFSTDFTADVASDVVVYQTPFGDAPDDVTQILNSTEFNVAFIGGGNIVQVTLITPAAAGDIITIIRNTPANRLNLYTNTNFTPSMLNNDFGILTLVDQQAQLVNQQIGPRYNYSATINNTIDNILPILTANQTWVKNNGNTAFIPLNIPSSGIAPTNATYVTATNQVSTLANSFQLIAGSNVTLTPGVNTLTVSVTGESISAGSINDLAYYASNGSVISPLATANNGVLATNGTGVPSISSTLPTAVQDNITQLGTITIGVWNGSVIGGTYGGTGVNNGASVLTYGGNVTFSGAHNFTGTLTGDTNVTFPTSGTLATTSGSLATLTGDSGTATASAGNINVVGTGSGLTFTGSSDTLTLGGTLNPAHGGLGLTSITTHNLIVGNGTSTPNLLAPSSTSGVPLISQGVSSDPVYGTAVVAGGGTGVTSVTISPTATEFAGWDANKNLSANNFLSGYTTTATAASITTLTVSSTQSQFFTGSTTQTVVLPVTSTLVLGQSFYIVNNSSGVVTVQSSGGNTVQVMAAGSNVLVTCILTSGTSASSWNSDYAFNAGTGSGTVNSGTTGQLAYYAGAGTTVSGGQLGNVKGTATNDSASAGNVGEVISSILSSASSVTVTTGTVTDITSISLTAGDWDLYGNIAINCTGMTVPVAFVGWASATSATQPGAEYCFQVPLNSSNTLVNANVIPYQRISLSTTTTIYLSTKVFGTSGNGTGYGGINARRAR